LNTLTLCYILVILYSQTACMPFKVNLLLFYTIPKFYCNKNKKCQEKTKPKLSFGNYNTNMFTLLMVDIILLG